MDMFMAHGIHSDQGGHDLKDTKGATNTNETPAWLFSFGASDVEAKASRQGQMTFSVDAGDCSVITAFTDRPDRLTRQIKMKHFARDFDDMFGENKPNASLTHWSGERFHNHGLEIESIKKRKGQYIIKTNLTEYNYINAVVPSVDSSDAEIVGIPNPFSLGSASFFIDSNSSGCDSPEKTAVF